VARKGFPATSAYDFIGFDGISALLGRKKAQKPPVKRVQRAVMPVFK
jgi:hypothetical protein